MRRNVVLNYGFSALLLIFGQKETPIATKISLNLASSLCKQFHSYWKDCEIPPPRKLPDPTLPNLCGTAKWKPCGPGDNNCKPFTTIISCDGGGGNSGGKPTKPAKPTTPVNPGKGHKRDPVTGNAYPSVVGCVQLNKGYPEHVKMYFLYGHAFFIDSSTLLTTAVIANRLAPEDGLYNYFFVFGETSKSKLQEGVKVKKTSVHPKFDGEKLENNFGLIHLDKPVDFNDKVKSIALAKPGQTCSGQSKYASWPKMRMGDSEVWNYHDQLHEVTSVKMLTESQRQNTKCKSSEFCTAPLLCGLWDQGSPLICSADGKEFAYAISSGYFIDYANSGEVCGGYSTFISVIDALDWIKEATKSI